MEALYHSCSHHLTKQFHRLSQLFIVYNIAVLILFPAVHTLYLGCSPPLPPMFTFLYTSCSLPVFKLFHKLISNYSWLYLPLNVHISSNPAVHVPSIICSAHWPNCSRSLHHLFCPLTQLFTSTPSSVLSTNPTVHVPSIICSIHKPNCSLPLHHLFYPQTQLFTSPPSSVLSTNPAVHVPSIICSIH